ncbi:hypothetical protein A1O3_00871 [Capronia epimyces CBS 606.96]|uniref:Uncharacterized protein n=1 Tax=Capronia epimyces CBS 606.96 TaxID=1182542 RepID=W9YSS9_9EURO|nr:uncharacterized protein A1O3_00871 [Capronia epimyces CBS 606.96]EXJ92321.1 hypothetical protein A1O3_00871 [Capronia epimyces CBS 606.96]
MCVTLIFRGVCPDCGRTSGPDVHFERLCEADIPCTSRNERPLRLLFNNSSVPCGACLADRLERVLTAKEDENDEDEDDVAETNDDVSGESLKVPGTTASGIDEHGTTWNTLRNDMMAGLAVGYFSTG